MRPGAEVEDSGETVTVRVRIPAILPGFGAELAASAAEVRS
jgi:hypothetical protein